LQTAAEQPLLPGEEPPAPPVDPVASLADEIAGIVLSVTAVLSPALPSLKRIYTPETTRAAGAAVAAVCVKHGWLSGGLMGEWGEEITAAVVLLPLAITTYKGVKGDVEAIKAQAIPAQKKPPEIQAQKTVEAGPATVPEVAAGAGVVIGAPMP
jgi:hypothetical protein